MIRQFLSRVRGHDRINDNRPPAAASNGRTIEPPSSLLLLALTDPMAAHRKVEELARERFGPGAEIGKDVRVTYPLDRLLQLPHDAIWGSSAAAMIRESTEELVAASRELTHEEIFNPHYGPVDPAAYNLVAYFKCTRLRVLRLYEALQRRGIRSGTILEVGSLYGCFSFLLQRLGYDVTAIDRYDSYGAGFRPLVALMKSAGVEVVSTTRENEDDILAALGQYDCGITMAVVEHIPHTPRVFLEGLRRHVRSGGILAADTPNLARYWNRVRFQAGESTFMDIKSQYHTEIPFEGHHREYSAAEMHWIFQQLACEEIVDETFDQNLIQFEAIDRPHIECLLRIIEDPSHADMILTTGRVSCQ